MNIRATSHEEILSRCRQLVMEKGMAAIDMRSVASACGVALGALYNYFPSKAALISATVESVWTDIFFAPEQAVSEGGFLNVVVWVHQSLARGKRTYPGFFSVHAISFAGRDKMQARQVMQAHFGRIRERMLQALRGDHTLRPDAFDEALTPEAVVDLAFHALLAAAMEGKQDVEALLALLRRALY